MVSTFLTQQHVWVTILTSSVAGCILGLFANWLRRELRRLGFSIETSSIVPSGLTKLRMSYDDRAIRRLDVHKVKLTNLGNRPLTQLPVRLGSEHRGEIVDMEVHPPAGSVYAHRLETDQYAVVTLDLLNPGESATLILTIANATQSKLYVVARAESLRLIEQAGASALWPPTRICHSTASTYSPSSAQT